MKGIDRESLETFAEETASRLARIAAGLDRLAKSRPVEMEAIHGIFRETHSLKGAANLMGMKPVEQLAHKLEDVLAQIRDGIEEPDAELVAILEAGYARIRQLLENPHVLPLIDAGREIAGLDRLLRARCASGSG